MKGEKEKIKSHLSREKFIKELKEKKIGLCANKQGIKKKGSYFLKARKSECTFYGQ